MDSKFSQKVKDILAYSKEEAIRLNNNNIGTEHIFLGILVSPSHLCLILTAKYFKTDLASMYRYIFVSISIVAGFGIIWFLFLIYPSLKVCYILRSIFLRAVCLLQDHFLKSSE